MVRRKERKMKYSIECSENSIAESQRFYESLGFDCRIIEENAKNILSIAENEKICKKNGIYEISYLENLDKIITWSGLKTENVEETVASPTIETQTSKWCGAGSSTIFLGPRHLSEDEKTSFLTDILSIHDPNNNELLITHSYSNFSLQASMNEFVNDDKNENMDIINFKKCKIGVLASGGDSPGMNTCLGTVLKLGKKYGIEIVCFKNGFTGLVTDKVFQMKENSTILEQSDELTIEVEPSHSNLKTTTDKPFNNSLNFLISPETFDFNTAGTLIGTARCAEYRTDKGFKAAIRTILKYNLYGIIIMGGDGSMRGGKVLSERYHETAKEILESEQHLYKKPIEGESIFETNDISQFIRVIHIPFSIDNDIPSAYTIGTDTALQTIADSSVILHSTFSAHNRLYVMEVMGRDSSYLSTVGGVSFADFVIYDTKLNKCDQNKCPERDWISPLIKKVRACHKKCFAVVLSENAQLCRTHHKDLIENLVENGILTNTQAESCPPALDQPSCKFERVKPEYVKCLVSPYIESRDLTLGHLQRGCKPLAYDRIISVISGLEAINEILHTHNHNMMSKKKSHGDFAKEDDIDPHHDKETKQSLREKEHRAISIFLNHNNFIKRDLSDLLYRIDNNLQESGIKDLIERVVRLDININGCFGQNIKNLLQKESVEKSAKILFIMHSYPVPGINMLINKIYQKLSKSNIKCYASKNGFDGLLSHNICEVEGEYNEEADCVFGYSFHDKYEIESPRQSADSKKSNNHIDNEGVGPESQRTHESSYSQQDLKEMFKTLERFDRIVVIGEKEAIEFIERIENIQENEKSDRLQSKFIIVPFSKYIHSVPGSYSVLSHIVNLIDSIRNTYNERIDIKLSDESLALKASLAVGGKCKINDVTQKQVTKQQIHEQRNQSTPNKQSNTTPNSHIENISHNSGYDARNNYYKFHRKGLVKEAEICTFSDRKLFSCDTKQTAQPHQTKNSITLDLTLLESPKKLHGWDRALVVIYSVFCAELILHELQDENMVIFENYHDLVQKYKQSGGQSRLQVLLVAEHPKILSKDQFFRWAQLEQQECLVYRKIIDIIECHLK